MRAVLVWPLLVAVYLAAYWLFGPHLTVNNGLGWDGSLYAVLAESFPDAIGSGIGPHWSGRVLPSGIIYCVSRILGIELSEPAAVVAAFRIYNAILFIGSAWLWSLASAGQGRSIAAFGFIGIFVNFHAMVGVQYSSVQTDTTAMFLSMAMLYGWLYDNRLIIYAATLAGAFTWPVALICGLLLVLFPRGGTMLPAQLPYRPYFAAAAALIFAALLAVALSSRVPLCCGAPEVAHGTLWPSAAIALAYVLYVGYAATQAVSMPRFDRTLLRRLGAAALLLLAVFALTRLQHVQGPDDGMPTYLLGSALTAVAKPGAFLVAHVTYLGPAFLLALIWAPALFRTARGAGLGAAGILCLFFAMSVNSESRQLYFWWPFVVYLLGEALIAAGVELRGRPLMILALASLLLSKFYLPLGGTMPDPEVSPLVDFPWQWFFMNQGPWMSWAGYAMNLALTATAAALIIAAWGVRLGRRGEAGAGEPIATSSSPQSSPQRG